MSVLPSTNVLQNVNPRASSTVVYREALNVSVALNRPEHTSTTPTTVMFLALATTPRHVVVDGDLSFSSSSLIYPTAQSALLLLLAASSSQPVDRTVSSLLAHLPK
jgi:hypothetical protein